MAVARIRGHLSDRLTSRRGAWITLGIVVLVAAALFGLTSGASAPVRTGQAPVGSEATQVSDLLERFPDADRQPVLVVASRADGAELIRTDL